MPAPVSLRIPQPCAQSWDAMRPTGPGRHCAACQKTVVDFTHQTDAQILAHLAQAAGETCGHFQRSQLGRPLLPAPQVGSRRYQWRTWMATVGALWSLRLVVSPATQAQPPAAHQTACPAQPAHRSHSPTRPGRTVRGVVRDSATQAVVTGVAIFLKGENRSAITDANGYFSLWVPAGPRARRHRLVLHAGGYHSRVIGLPLQPQGRSALRLALRPDSAAVAGVKVVAPFREYRREYISGAVSAVGAEEIRATRPAPWRPRIFWRWLTQPFRRSAS